MDNQQVAHLWANKSRESAKGSHFYFEGDTIYSYGSHFPIARHFRGVILITSKTYSVSTTRHFRGVILITSKTYSVSTTRHVSYVRQACTHLTTFEVSNPLDDPSGKDVREYGEQLKDLAMSVARARSPEWKIKHLERVTSEANAFCERFGFKTRFAMPENMDELRAKAKDQAEKTRKANKAKLAKQEKDKAERVQRWLAGETVSLYDVQSVYLRTRLFKAIGVERVEMETSKGATVPIEDAHKAFRFVMLKREMKKCPQCGNISVNTTCPKCVVPQQFNGWHRNGDQFPIGEFHLDAVNEQGVVAGCHRITWDEIERFAKTQKWI